MESEEKMTSIRCDPKSSCSSFINIHLPSLHQEGSPIESWRQGPLKIYEDIGVSGIRVSSEGYRNGLCKSPLKKDSIVSLCYEYWQPLQGSLQLQKTSLPQIMASRD